MDTNKRTDTDYMLSRALSYPDRPSPELNRKLKQRIANVTSSTITSFRPNFVAIAASIILLLALSAAALAATGVFGDLFMAATRGQPSIGSTQAVVDNEYFTEVVSLDNSGLSLRVYYADNKEFGFDFVLSGADVPIGFDMLYIGALTLEITDDNGATGVWEWFIDRENDVESRIFPGGVFLLDRKNDIYKYEPSDGIDFTVSARAAETDDGMYNVSVIVTFNGINESIGDKARITIGDLTFVYFGYEQDESPNDEYVSLTGSWSFDIDIDSNYDEVTALSYVPVEHIETPGIMVSSVTILPTVCRIEAVIDFERSGLGNPANVDRANELGTNSVKLDMLELHVYAVVDGRRPYGSWSSGYTDAVDGIATCWFEIESSLFFDAPENITLRLENLNLGSAAIEIMLTLS